MKLGFNFSKATMESVELGGNGLYRVRSVKGGIGVAKSTESHYYMTN